MPNSSNGRAPRRQDDEQSFSFNTAQTRAASPEARQTSHAAFRSIKITQEGNDEATKTGPSASPSRSSGQVIRRTAPSSRTQERAPSSSNTLTRRFQPLDDFASSSARASNPIQQPTGHNLARRAGDSPTSPIGGGVRRTPIGSSSPPSSRSPPGSKLLTLRSRNPALAAQQNQRNRAAKSAGQQAQNQQRRRRRASASTDEDESDGRYSDDDLESWGSGLKDPVPVESDYEPTPLSLSDLRADWPTTPMSQLGLVEGVESAVRFLGRRFPHGHSTTVELGAALYQGQVVEFRNQQERDEATEVARDIARDDKATLLERQAAGTVPKQLITQQTKEREVEIRPLWEGQKAELAQKMIKGQYVLRDSETETGASTMVQAVLAGLRNNGSYTKRQHEKFVGMMMENLGARISEKDRRAIDGQQKQLL